MKRLPILIATILMLALLFCSCGKDTISVEYTATEGGYIDGEASQSKEKDDNGSASFDLVIATANDGYRFVGWSDGVSDKIRFDVLSESSAFTAIFEKINYGTLTYATTEGGAISGIPVQMAEIGQATTEVSAFAQLGYRFIGWSDGLTSPTRTDIVDGDKTITAIFSNKASVEYKAGEGGYISGEATQEVVLGSHSQAVVAVANEGYRFAGWNDDDDQAIRTDLIEGDVVYTASFQKCYTIEYTCNSERGSLVGSLIQTVDEGAVSQAVTAEAGDGYEFVCWSNGATTRTVVVIANENTTLTAYFMEKSSGLPVVSITTETGKDVTSKETYIGCVISVHDTEGNYNIIEATGQIRGRGNSTWTKFPKKPYKVKFDVKQDLFGYGKAKDWVLLADYIDNSLIRNNIAYSVAGEFSELAQSPDCQSVEVYLNGKYHGVYLLCEQIEINEHRVEIEENITNTDTGYLIEMDQWAVDGNSGEIYVSVPDTLKSNRAYTIKAPDEDEITAAHKEYIRQYISDCISALYGNDYERVKELIDVKSFAQAYIVYELTKNPDVNYSSFYMYKNVGGTMRCGPVWDFDMSLGNVAHKGNGVFEDPALLWAKNQNPWFKGLLRFEEFRSLVCTELAEYAPIITAKLDEIFAYTYEKQEAYEKNFEKWNVIGKNTWTNPDYIVEITTWEGHVEYCRAYLEKSLEALLAEYPIE